MFEEGSKCTIIGKNAFCNCVSLEEIVLPKKLYKIGDYAFHNCQTLLKTFIIPSTVHVIGNFAFGCERYWFC